MCSPRRSHFPTGAEKRAALARDAHEREQRNEESRRRLAAHTDATKRRFDRVCALGHLPPPSMHVLTTTPRPRVCAEPPAPARHACAHYDVLTSPQVRALAEAEHAQYGAEHAQDGASSSHDASCEWPGLEAVKASARCEWPGLEAGSSKLRALVRLLRDELPPAEKAVVFTRFPDALPLIGHVLQRAAIGTISLKEDSWWRPEWKKASAAAGAVAGAVAGATLAEPVDTFRTDARCRVMLLDAGVMTSDDF